MTRYMKINDCSISNPKGKLKWGELHGGHLRIFENVVLEWSNSTGSFVFGENVLYEKKTSTGFYTQRILSKTELEERAHQYGEPNLSQKKNRKPPLEKLVLVLCLHYQNGVLEK